MGFVTSLTSALEETAGVNEDLANILGESEEWQEFLSGSYADSQEIESKPLGGVAGAESSDDDEEEDQLVSYHYFELCFSNNNIILVNISTNS